jgi:hydroxymethylpyrimidine pyrophosphatase-like HAD family hydrolase
MMEENKFIDIDPVLQRAAEEFGPASRWGEASKHLDKIRVIYSDMDGTMLGPLGNFFLNIQREYTLRPARALVEALKRDVDIVLVSGRSRKQLKENARIMGLRNYIAELGVEIVYDQGKEVIINTGALGEEHSDLYRSIMRSGVVDWLLSTYPRSIEFHTPWADMRDCTPLLRGLLDLDEVNRILDERYPGMILVDNGVLPYTSQTLDVKETRAYHLMPKGVSKEKAAAEDMRLRGFKRSETIAVGDSEADLAFASEVGVFFLVRNGLFSNPHLVSALASYNNVVVTEGFLNEGWAEAVELAVLEKM